MLSRFTRLQLIAFVVVTTTTVLYSAFAYVDVPRLFGVGRYEVTVELPRGGNLYEQSIATLRGAPVGRVLEVRPTAGGVAADVQLEERARIPRDARVEVRSVSAAGEQYLDFAADGAAGPYLVDGDTVAVRQASVPVPTAELLQNANQLVSNLPQDDLRTAVDETGTAFAGRGRDLQILLDGLLPLQREATENLGPTVGLIDTLQPVLGTQADLSPQIRAWAGDLDVFTGALRGADEPFRRTLDVVPPLAGQVNGLVDDFRPTLPVLLRDLTQVGQVVRVYNPAVAHTLTLLPAAANGLQSALNNSAIPGAVNLYLITTINDPPACTGGFVQNRRDWNDLTPVPPPTDVGCKVPPARPDQANRGARNYPCPNDPARRGPTARDCGLEFQTPEETTAAQEAAIRTQVERAGTNPKTEAEEREADAGGAGAASGDDVAAAAGPQSGGGLGTGPVLVGNEPPGGQDWRSLLTDPLGVDR